MFAQSILLYRPPILPPGIQMAALPALALPVNGLHSTHRTAPHRFRSARFTGLGHVEGTG